MRSRERGQYLAMNLHDRDMMKIGERKGAQEKAVENAQNLLKMNLGNPEQIAQAVGLPLEQVLELQKEFAQPAPAN